MARTISTVLRMIFVTILILGVAYPLTITLLAKLFFPRQAGGSLIFRNAQPIGSALIGQPFTTPAYFHPRPSAAGEGYDPTSSGASMLGPTSKALVDQVTRNLRNVLAENPGMATDRIPVDMVTASASGLDPDISPANAQQQIARVARARGVTQDEVRRIVSANTSARQFRLLGEPRVNVLRLNLSLDAAFGSPPQ